MTICLILVSSPKSPIPHEPPIVVSYIKIKSEKKSDFRCRQPKTNFRFFIYTPHPKKHVFFFFNALFLMYFCLSFTYVKLNSEHFISIDFLIQHLFIEISMHPKTEKFPISPYFFSVFFPCS